ncbi:MAG: exodeoxyribonuclease V subunit gamma [Tahibacter sp.]
MLHPSQRGILVYRASRLEALLQPLLQLLDVPPENILAPQVMIAAHPGVKQWLFGAVARARGNGGIVANLEIALPSAWLDQLAREVLGEAAVALRPYQREFLRWRIHRLLGEIDSAEVAAYLSGNDAARRRFQLADRLARIYTQYLVYRPDWLQAWADGKLPSRDRALDPGFLAILWKKLRASIALPHRGELLRQLAMRLEQPDTLALATDPLHVFGVSHLAPSELAVLQAVARHRPVVLYVPDPCRERWASIPDDRTRLRELIAQGPESPEAESLFFERGHPLLARWARMGQHFMLALEDMDADIDVRHWEDLVDTVHIGNRLQGVQESIRQFKPELMTPIATPLQERRDGTLRIHACHTRLRELEVLRDALLRARGDDPSIKPGDIVVMAPDIQAYVPLLPAVFGEAGKREGALPYHLADVAVLRAHPLFEAFRHLLELQRSRLTATEVVDLLAVPQIAERLDLSAADVDVIRGWLREGRVAWALDAEFRRRFDVPAIDAHSFAWGLDRMLAGYVMGVADDETVVALKLPDGTELAPLAGISGPQASLLGSLDSILVELAAWFELTGRAHRASVWAEQLERRFDALFLINPSQRDAREAKAVLLRFVRALASEPADSGLDPELEFSVVRELLLARLSGVPERQRFLMGGVTFCGMVPQRAIPFRVVAVLGLNDGEFPRLTSDGGLDLMSRHRRLGDRDVRNDDRYLFLETVMAARDVLHLSFIGEGARDGKPRNPAAPLAELIAALDDAARDRNLLAASSTQDPASPDSAAPASALAQHDYCRPWMIRHPLQAFDARYFDGSDPALFSFRHDFAAMGPIDDAPVPARPFVADALDAGAPVDAALAQRHIELRDVLAYYRDPARQLLAQGLKLRLDALDEDRLLDSEPLEARFEALDQVAKRLFFDAAKAGLRAVPTAQPDWLRLTGLLPPGRTGEEAWRQECCKVDSLLEASAVHPLFAQRLPDAQRAAIDLALDGYRVQGELRRVRDRDDTRWVIDVFPGRYTGGKIEKRSESSLDFKVRIGFFLEWALLRLADPDGVRRVRACVVLDGRRDGWEDGFHRWDDAFMAAVRAGDVSTRDSLLADLTYRVAQLLAYWQRSQQQPQWYFPATSWAALATDPGAAEKKWNGGFFASGERDYAPGYARLLAGDRDFGAGEYAESLRADAEQLLMWITLPDRAEQAA